VPEYQECVGSVGPWGYSLGYTTNSEAGVESGPLFFITNSETGVVNSCSPCAGVLSVAGLLLFLLLFLLGG